MAKHNIHAFSLIEILVVTSIFAILSGITYSVFIRSKDSSKQTVCISNIRQIGESMLLYGSDHDDAIPVELHPQYREIIEHAGHIWGEPYDPILMGAPTWPTAPGEYGITKEMLHCPLDNGWSSLHPGIGKTDFEVFHTSYVNDTLGGVMQRTFTAISNPTKTTMLMDGPNASHGTDGTPFGMALNCMSYDIHVQRSTRFDCVNNTTKLPGQL